MTIEQLRECSAADLEKMTDEQLLEYFKPYLTATRPELAKLTQARAKVTGVTKGKASAEEEAMRIAAQFGFNLRL
jgi:hypothetical protein